MEKGRYYIDTMGNDDNAYAEAMRYACQLGNADKDIGRIIILVHTKQNTGWFERLYDAETVKKLHTGFKFKDCNPVFKIETMNTYRDRGGSHDIVIACGLDSKDVFKIDDYYRVKSIIAIPWLRESMEKWVRTWGPVEIRGNQAAVVQYPEASCIVRKAMDALTDTINMSTGITNPTDNDLAKSYIRALHKYEVSLDKNVVGAYLMREKGWDSDVVAEMEQLVETLNDGRYFKGGNTTGLQHYYKRWEEECKE